MKLNLGRYYGLPFRERLYRKLDYLTDWHKWFAWYPVRLIAVNQKEERVVWLEWVERTYIHARILTDALNQPYALKRGRPAHRAIDMNDLDL